MVLRMDHDERTLAPRRREHFENLPVVELERIVGRVDLEGCVAILDQRGQLLAGDLIGWVGNDQVKGIVYSRFGIGAGVIVLDTLTYRESEVCRAEGHEGGG